MWKAPKPFDVVWCRFPYRGGGARHHPCLVLHTGQQTGEAAKHEAADSSRTLWVIVAGGTSTNKQGQWLRRIKPTDFVLQGSAASRAGLQNPSAFQLEPQFVLKLPWTADCFDAAPGQTSPVMGAVDIASERMRVLFKTAASREFKLHLKKLCE